MVVNAKDIKPGARIRFVHGAGFPEAMGTAYGRYASKFYGCTCRVKMDDHTFTAIVDAYSQPSDRSANGSGIGAYLWTDEPQF